MPCVLKAKISAEDTSAPPRLLPLTVHMGLPLYYYPRSNLTPHQLNVQASIPQVSKTLVNPMVERMSMKMAKDTQMLYGRILMATYCSFELMERSLL